MTVKSPLSSTPRDSGREAPTEKASRLERENAKLREENRRLREEVDRLRKENERFEKENARFSARLRKNSRNSSKPPSSDGPSAAKPRKKKHTGRKRGGQPGHEGKTRELVPSEQAHHHVEHFPEACDGCGKRLTEKEHRTDPALDDRHRRQQWEIPPVEPEITEHQCHLGQCGDCGVVSRGEFPDRVTRSMFGPNLMALVVLLTGPYGMSKRSVAALLRSICNIAVSIGTISNIEHRVSLALRVPVGILHAMIQLAKVVYADETSWKEQARRFYIWGAATKFGAIYIVRKSRSARVALELLGVELKVVITDRYRGYLWIPLRWRQICWAHLKRDFEWIAGFKGRAGWIGRELLACERELFGLWHRVRDGTLKRSSFRTRVSPIRKRIRSLLEEGVALEVEGVSGMCKDMLKVHPALYTFVRVEGVEPTNNRIETGMSRIAKWRRVSFGTQSRRGSEFVGRILSVVATLRIQGRDVFPYLREACEAALEGRNAPLLVSLEDQDEDRHVA